MISLNFLLGAFLTISAVPLLIFAGLLFKRLPLFIGIIMLAHAVGGRADAVRSFIVFLLMLAVVIGFGMAGSMLLAKGVLLWVS